MLNIKQNLKQNMLLPILFLVVFIITFTLEPIDQMLAGFYRILTSPSVLLSDYLLIGGLAATLFNVALTLLMNLALVYKLKLKITGPIFACLLTIAGFAFFGKNLFNALPMYFGIYLYAKATKTEYKNHILVILLSSGISPIVSFLMFGAGISFWYSVPLAIAVGIAVGFILPAFNSHALRFHQGYNLYNTGFSMGVLSMMLTGIITSFGITITRSAEVNNQYHWQLFFAILIISFGFIIFAYFINPHVHKKMSIITKNSGRLVTDFVRDAGKDATMLNIGIMGLLALGVIFLLQIQINGPIMGAILTIMGFSAFGKHVFNSVPVILGAVLAVYLTPIEMTIGAQLAILFVTGIAPIAGRFGFGAGLIAGFIHLLITSLALQFQGGFDLYNNGFAAGFVAAVLSPVFMTFQQKKEEE